MATPGERSAAEIDRLQRCINDLVGILALPAVWTGCEPPLIAGTLIDALLGMLRLDLAYARLHGAPGEAPVRVARFAQPPQLQAQPQETIAQLDGWLRDDPHDWPALARKPVGAAEISLVPLRLGLLGEFGVIVTGSRRADFPLDTERLLLTVAANQAAIGLQEARLRREQRRIADELDRRVAQRTRELAAANEELKREVAERKLTEEKLRHEERELKRSEAFLAEAQRLSSTGSFSWRVATNEIGWSEELYRIFELPQGAPVTFAQIEARIHPEDLPTFQEHAERSRRDGGVVEFEFRLQMPDRTVKHLRVVAHGSADEHGELEYIGAIQDLTERRRSEEALNNARSQLAHVARVTSLGVLTASIAHEVNQPLAAIITNGESGLRWLARPQPSLEKVREIATRVVADARRASEIIGRIRTIATPQGSKPTPLSLYDIVQETMVFLRHEFQSRNVSVTLDLAPALPRVIGNRTQLQQVVVNLAINAIQAMAASASRRLSVRTLRSAPEAVCCIVEDNGPGIEAAHIPRLFDTFFTTKESGMGMGLPICRSIIEAHGGHIAADNDSALGGARFSFTLPCDP